MTQDEVNRAEWENPQNWSDNIVGVYFSKRDNRSWVPKRRPAFGWTLNLANRWGAWWLVAFLVIPPVLSGLLFRRKRGTPRSHVRAIDRPL
jgi:uncharacterized membrane protein